jgi:hypothetical protein
MKMNQTGGAAKKKKKSSSSKTTATGKVHTGPNGGKYRIKNGKKMYLK